MFRGILQRRRWLIVAGVIVVVVSIVSFEGQVSEEFQLPSTKAPESEQSVTTSTMSKAPEGSNQPLTISKATETGKTAQLIHEDIITTVFWVGEGSSEANGEITNTESAWVDNWTREFGGEDSPANRNGYLPAAFTPLQNAFYAALPYNDYDGNDNRKSGAERCLAATGNSRTDYSWCKNAWLKITLGNRTVYAQWEDVGPFGEDDTAYVFGSAKPANGTGERAGLDISPATRDYLIPGNHDGDSGTYRTTWQFVPASAVPNGPWRQTISTSTGRHVGQ